jgi:hypothetical protein
MISVTLEIREVETVEVLCAAKLPDPPQDHGRESIGHAIERLLELLHRT